VPSWSAADTSALAFSSVVAMAKLAARLASMSGVVPRASAAFTSACQPRAELHSAGRRLAAGV
jgi:hypothetical protein